MNEVCTHTATLMGTVVSIQVIGSAVNGRGRPACEQAIARALAWFQLVEASCTRFDERSEVRQLSGRIGEPVRASEIVFAAVQFALAVAAETGGAFDPTVGGRMAARGFNQNYRSGAAVPFPGQASEDVCFRDVELDPERRTITLRRLLTLDLGAVAKGLAVDLAARELKPFRDFAIDAGGDLYLGGRNADGQPWSVGIRHPRDRARIIETFHVSDQAVCTSGDYERRAPSGAGGHHIMDPRTGESATTVASMTVLARSAMVADGLATAAFVLGPAAGMALLERHGAAGLMVTPDLERFAIAAGGAR